MNLLHILRDDKGAVLVTGLLLMLILIPIGIVAMQSAAIQERMAGNLEQQALAFQAAEAGLRDGEELLNNTVVLPPFDNTEGFYLPAEPDGDPNWRTQGFWNDDSPFSHIIYQGDDLGLPPPYPLPRYIIEFMTLVSADSNDSVKFTLETEEDFPSLYRITSRGVSPNGRSNVTLQTTFVR